MYINEFDALKQRIDDFSKILSIKNKQAFLNLKENFDIFFKMAQIKGLSDLRNYKAGYAELLFQLIMKFNLEEYRAKATESLMETIEDGKLNNLDVSSYIRMLTELQNASPPSDDSLTHP
ncbi:hypothetical protein [Spirosoma fluviale]|uniref:Uncharacterized protein n=1 Tax=Spirosoma fluviale TaxID=1597977 RepID=A0A286FAN2_9BACT|nr:hypothetical protein [Spirosoma fluviale]SOD80285.1 hypothetical protein SAMN06269250_1325 [Spirosoma fluviale]